MSWNTIDLRSDTVTRPGPEMRAAMAAAEVGDDVYGEDPTVNRLEQIAAALTGQEAALFVTSGTQSNLLALLTHCRRGDEYIAGQEAHTYRYEAGGGAVLGGIQPQPLEFNADGELEIERIKSAIKPDDPHFARTALLCLENTQGGKVLSLEYLQAARDCAAEHGLKTHLDGARVFNAAMKLGVPVSSITGGFDSVSICLSKGLGAPVGSLLCGRGPWIGNARKWRKMVGGGLRQAGILAAAGIHALAHNVERLTEDHDNAALLAAELATIEALEVDPRVDTNMVYFLPRHGGFSRLTDYLYERNILISGPRLVTHMDVAQF